MEKRPMIMGSLGLAKRRNFSVLTPDFRTFIFIGLARTGKTVLSNILDENNTIVVDGISDVNVREAKVFIKNVYNQERATILGLADYNPYIKYSNYKIKTEYNIIFICNDVDVAKALYASVEVI